MHVLIAVNSLENALDSTMAVLLEHQMMTDLEPNWHHQFVHPLAHLTIVVPPWPIL